MSLGPYVFYYRPGISARKRHRRLPRHQDYLISASPLAATSRGRKDSLFPPPAMRLRLAAGRRYQAPARQLARLQQQESTTLRITRKLLFFFSWKRRFCIWALAHPVCVKCLIREPPPLTRQNNLWRGWARDILLAGSCGA